MRRLRGIIFAFVLIPAFASAQSIGELQAQIASLLAEMQQMQSQLMQLQGAVNAQFGTPLRSTEIPGSVNSATTSVSVTTNTSDAKCINLAHAIGPGATDAATGGDVSRLQQFLKDEGVYDDAITGNVGTLTVAAIQKWQAARGIVSVGDPDSTGYGYVGPRTRAAMSCAPSAETQVAATVTDSQMSQAGQSYIGTKLSVPSSGTLPASLLWDAYFEYLSP